MKNTNPIPGISAIKQKFIDSISKTDFNTLPISDYSKVYLENTQAQIEYIAGLYTILLSQVVLKTKKDLPSLCLVDYGGGTGLFSVFAKMCGIGKVIYNDIYDVSCHDVVYISKALNFLPDEIIEGDIDAVANSYTNKADALTSMDVIEHIYDLEKFFSACSNIHPQLLMVHYTGANPYNPVTNRRLRKSQKKAEFTGFTKAYGHKERDNIKPYLDLRKEIITGHFPDMRKTEINKYAVLTRGLNQLDIISQVNRKLIDPAFEIKALKHSTNTCDPYTGNWHERLLLISKYNKLARSNGFQLTVIPSFYNEKQQLVKKIILSVLNTITRLFNTVSSAPGFFLIFNKMIQSGNKK